MILPRVCAGMAKLLKTLESVVSPVQGDQLFIGREMHDGLHGFISGLCWLRLSVGTCGRACWPCKHVISLAIIDMNACSGTEQASIRYDLEGLKSMAVKERGTRQ